MTTAGSSPLQSVATLPFAGSMTGAVAILASPAVRALAAEWVATSQAYFAAVERWARTSNTEPTRNQIETECDLAVMEDEAVRRRIIDLRATEPGAMALKAAVFLVHLPRPDHVDVVLSDGVAADGPDAEVFAFAIARDMADVLGPSVQALAAAARPGYRP